MQQSCQRSARDNHEQTHPIMPHWVLAGGDDAASMTLRLLIP